MQSVPIVRLVVLFALLFAAGCASNNKGFLERTKWVSMKQTVHGNSLEAGAITIEFTSDTTMLYTIVDQEPYRGEYVLGWGNKVVFRFDRPLNGHSTHTEKIILLGSRLIMADSDGTELIFLRGR
jgi:hypothetical protein